MSNNGNIQPVLDATCGGRMIWFDKKNPLALFVDKRVMIDETIKCRKVDLNGKIY